MIKKIEGVTPSYFRNKNNMSFNVEKASIDVILKYDLKIA
jgi:hypothetical protein